MKRNIKYYRINYQITAPTIRLLDETGKQIGIVNRQDALRRAQIEEKDLVEIAAKAKPPVVKLIDFKKFKYLEAKREREIKRSAKKVDIKELRLSPFMGDHDFQTKISQAQSFLKNGNQLKIKVPFRGREISHKEFGYNIINKAIDRLKECSKVIRTPYFEGKTLISLLMPTK